MTQRHSRIQTGATLVELLVVMAIIAALGAMALMLLPSIANSDRTLKGTAEVQASIRIAQAMAGSAKLPRGVRLLVQPGSTVSTEIQYLESPPITVPDPQALVGGRATNPNGDSGPTVEITYVTDMSGAITDRHCYIKGLNADQRLQVDKGSTLVLPTLGAWSRVKTKIGNMIDLDEVELEVYPDLQLGAGTSFVTYHFGIYGPPVPLIGEPTVPLPKDIGVDLALCSPAGSAGQPYDILFAPSGQTLVTPTNPTLNPNRPIYLWVRDVSKVTNLTHTVSPTWQFTDMTSFRQAGEQQIVGIRNGFIGTAPVLWPDATNGTYGTGQNPYYLAREQLR